MAKFSQGFNFTFQYKGKWVKCSLELSELDPDYPIMEQIQNMDEAVNITWQYLKNKIDNQVEDIVSEMDKED